MCKRFLLHLALMIALCFCGAGTGLARQPLPVQLDTAKVFEARAMNVLKQMSEYLKSFDQFTFRAEVNIDGVLSSGQKLQFERAVDTYVRRPNKVRAEFASEFANHRFWYDGKTMTLLNAKENLYARTEAPNTIDQALDFAMEKFGVTVPLVDLVVSDPYQSLTQNVKSATYVSLDNVRGRRCHHLAFTQATIDWQIWIEEGEMLVPRKLVLTYKQAPSQPQYSAIITEWNLTPRLSDLLFSFTASEGADEIKFLTAEGTN